MKTTILNKFVHAVYLEYEVMFNDSDEGPCWAADGLRLIKLYEDKGDAEKFVETYNPILEKAKKETTIVPRQPYNSILKEYWGFNLHDLDQGLENFKLVIKSYEVE